MRRVQVERLAIRRNHSAVTFNDGIEASAHRGPILERLRGAEQSGEMIDALLADYGTGWMVESVLPASDQWQRLELVC